MNSSENIPISNPYRLNDRELIEKSLAAKYKSLTDKVNDLKIAADEIISVKRFFDVDSRLSGFVFMTSPIFSTASFFDKGFAIVEQNSKKMYLDFKGEVFKIDTSETEIPKIAIKRPNPDLFPFEEKVDTFRSLYGYKNSNNEIIIPAKYKYASPFINGFAKVGILKSEWEKYNNATITYGLIDAIGRLILLCDFIELGDVYNDIVLYKKHVYSKGYVRTSSFNFDMKHEVKHLGFLSGYLKYNEIKPAIQKEIENIRLIETTIPSLKTSGEIDQAKEKSQVIGTKLTFILNT
ncbi:MAG: WG repeat-containing protein [Saprospiraceae bacterium]|nr:WG repeat-containing protein [Saprospiraceae bacterium]